MFFFLFCFTCGLKRPSKSSSGPSSWRLIAVQSMTHRRSVMSNAHRTSIQQRGFLSLIDDLSLLTVQFRRWLLLLALSFPRTFTSSIAAPLCYATVRHSDDRYRQHWPNSSIGSLERSKVSIGILVSEQMDGITQFYVNDNNDNER